LLPAWPMDIKCMYLPAIQLLNIATAVDIYVRNI